MTRSLLSVTVFVLFLSSSTLVPALDAAPVDSSPGAVVADADSDQALAEAVVTAARRYAFYDAFGWITATARDGVVTLDGVVREPFQRRGYESLVTRVPGVTSVVNNLEALPLSAFDDQLRGAALRAIYREATLAPLMRQPRPAIHVVVNNGRIRLEGVVRTELDRMLAEIGVRKGTIAFEVINNLQVEAS
jgi:osmotically-inducible protein OsmY